MHLVFLAGFGNSEGVHWQRLWYQSSHHATWVEHADWWHPVKDQWLADLNLTLATIDGPLVFVTHSMGCLLFTEWLRGHQNQNVDKVKGAFLVAPPDVNGPNFPEQAVNFSNLNDVVARCPVVVVASENDPYGSADYAKNFGRALGASVYMIGAKGHINADSELGTWPEGWGLLTEFIARIESRAQTNWLSR
jgi:predicted alpha/beta hydrolase family esterase